MTRPDPYGAASVTAGTVVVVELVVVVLVVPPVIDGETSPAVVEGGAA
jgi:hypothetical protein